MNLEETIQNKDLVWEIVQNKRGLDKENFGEFMFDNFYPLMEAIFNNDVNYMKELVKGNFPHPYTPNFVFGPIWGFRFERLIYINVAKAFGKEIGEMEDGTKKRRKSKKEI
jgi:hypothetical protein